MIRACAPGRALASEPSPRKRVVCPFCSRSVSRPVALLSPTLWLWSPMYILPHLYPCSHGHLLMDTPTQPHPRDTQTPSHRRTHTHPPTLPLLPSPVTRLWKDSRLTRSTRPSAPLSWPCLLLGTFLPAACVLPQSVPAWGGPARPLRGVPRAALPLCWSLCSGPLSPLPAITPCFGEGWTLDDQEYYVDTAF